jgi:hypothetical protein
MPSRLTSLLTASDIDPRGFVALTKALILMDLRGQHYGRATATRPHYLISPLFWVVGQCQFISAAVSLLLFARADVFFFAFANLSLSMLVIAATVLVEFQEVVFDPRDLDVIGHRPLSARTYAAARLANLMFYVGLMYGALNIIPLILGAGLRDAGGWYMPAYLVASLAGNLTTVAVVIGLLSFAGSSPRLDQWKELLAWTQIVLVFILFYGGQMMLRSGGPAILLWGAFPPAWTDYLPTTWLARFVEAAAVAPTGKLLLPAALIIGVALAAGNATLWRLGWLYRQMQPLAVVAQHRPMPTDHVGSLAHGLAGWLTRTSEERVGYWLCQTFLARDTGLRMRCLWSVNMAVAAVLLGVCTGQFANPLAERDARLVTLPILSVYLLALAVPPIVYQLSFSRDADAFWLLAAAPLERPAAVARGVCKALMLWLVAPLCLFWGVIALVVWGDPVAAALHTGLALLLGWLLALASLWLLADAPFSLPLARGGTLGPLALPLAVFSGALMPLAALHYLFAASPFFWIGAGLLGLAAGVVLQRQADSIMARRWETNR